MPLTFAETAWLAVLPLSGVIGGYIASYLVNNRTVYINSITKERSQWIGKLRESLADYIASLEIYNLSAHIMFSGRDDDGDYSVVSKTDFVELRRKLEVSATLLQLQLNPRGVIDGNLADMVALGSLHRDKRGGNIGKLQDLIVRHSQWLLKAEWEKVKWEARSNLWRLSHMGDAAKLLNEYQRWANTNGNLKPILEGLEKAKSVIARPDKAPVAETEAPVA